MCGRQRAVNSRRAKSIWAMLLVFGMVVGACVAYAQQAQRGQTSYMPVGIKEPFASIMARMSAAEPSRHQPRGSEADLDPVRPGSRPGLFNGVHASQTMRR